MAVICCCIASDINAEDNFVILRDVVQSGTCLPTSEKNLLPASSE